MDGGVVPVEKSKAIFKIERVNRINESEITERET
jgi:hypothetical protein